MLAALRNLAPECSGQIVHHRSKQLAISRVSVLHERDDSTRKLQRLRARRGDTIRIDGVHEETNQILFRNGVHRSPLERGELRGEVYGLLAGVGKLSVCLSEETDLCPELFQLGDLDALEQLDK